MRGTRQLLIIIIIFSYIPLCKSDSIQIVETTIFREGVNLMLNSKAELKLTDAIIEALESNILITFDFKMGFKKYKNRLFERSRISKTLRFELVKYALGKQYVVTDLNNKSKVSFLTLEAALNHLGDRRRIPILKLDSGDDRSLMEVAQQWTLVKTELPTPMVLPALFSSDWDLESKWYVRSFPLK